MAAMASVRNAGEPLRRPVDAKAPATGSTRKRSGSGAGGRTATGDGRGHHWVGGDAQQQWKGGQRGVGRGGTQHSQSLLKLK